MTIQELRSKNPGLPFYSVRDPEFKEFGEIVDIDTAELVEKAALIAKPECGASYVPTEASLENVAVRDYIETVVYGEMPIQIGYCWGENSQMTAMEWHKGSEINVAVTPIVLLLGRVADLEDGKYDSAKIKAFYLEKGDAVEVYGTSLHYCPCQVDENGFGCIVILPKGTNTDLSEKSENPHISAKNKWILCHGDSKDLIESGVPATIYGENWIVKY